MKTSLVACLALVVAPTAGLATPTDDLKAAITKLADAPNYSWSSTTESAGGGGGGRYGGGPVSGVVETGGCAVITRETPNGPSQTVIKGDQRVVQTPDGWATIDELRQRFQGGGGGGGGGRGGFGVAMAMGTVAPTDELNRAANAIGAFTVVDGAITGELSGDFLAQALRGGGRGGPGGAGGPSANGSGTIKVWVTDGVVSKYQVHVAGTITGRDGQERAIDRTTTTEIKNVGSTTVDVPADAMAKLGG